jgi:hypothetical protein
VMRGEKGSEFETRHGCSLRTEFCCWLSFAASYGLVRPKAIA